MWPVAYALATLGPAEEVRIRTLLATALGSG
jgi:hypothetical protein